MNLVTVSRLQRNPTVKSEIQMRNFETSIPVGFLHLPHQPGSGHSRRSVPPLCRPVRIRCPCWSECREIVHNVTNDRSVRTGPDPTDRTTYVRTYDNVYVPPVPEPNRTVPVPPVPVRPGPARPGPYRSVTDVTGTGTERTNEERTTGRKPAVRYRNTYRTFPFNGTVRDR